MKSLRRGFVAAILVLVVSRTASATEATPLPDMPAPPPGTAPPPPPAVSRTAGTEGRSLPDVPASPPDAAPPPPVVSGFAIELGTGGLSGARGGSLALGWGWKDVAGGLSVDFSHAGLTTTGQYAGGGESTQNALAVGPWMRAGMGRALDGRVELAGAMDVQYARQSTTVRTSAAQSQDATANGVIFRVGPAIRYWVTPSIAIGYTTQLSVTFLSGPLLAFTQSTTLGSSTDDASSTDVSLVGRFTVLAIF